MTIHNPNCDGDNCKSDHGPVKSLPLYGGANLILCRDCHAYEIAWRAERNADLGDKYDLPSWDSLTIYTTLSA